MISKKDIKSPFKFLDAYKKEDKDIFFGRTEETLQLYRLIRGHRSVLVFGPSGTGKTSLIQCGLANIMDPADWFPIYLRRGQDFLVSLADFLKGNGFLPKDQQTFLIEEIVEGLKNLGKNKLRPVYLIFDQFEEFLILGDKVETELMIQFLQLILNNERFLFCNVIFSIREEYLGSMEPLADKIPELMENRLRLELMVNTIARKVIEESFSKFQISLDHPDNAAVIVEKLKVGTSVQLPYLQVYLDQLWREDYMRTYPESQAYDGESPYPALEFTREEIDNFGGLKQVFQHFLTEQSLLIADELKSRFVKYENCLLEKTLDCFVTEDGTKKPLPFSVRDELIYIEGEAPESYINTLQKKSRELSTACFKELEKSRILRQDHNYFELAHDTLADLIVQKRSQENSQKKMEVLELIESGSKNNTYLSDVELVKYEDVFSELDLNTDLHNFIEKSKRIRKRNRRLKLLIPLAFVFFLFIWNVFKLQDSYDRMYGIHTFNEIIDTISDKTKAIRLAEYVYTLKKDTQYQQRLESNYASLFQHEEIQSQLSTLHTSTSLSNLKPGNFDVSEDGSFLVVKSSGDSESFGDYTLSGSHGDIIKFHKINYAYFLNQGDILLVALPSDTSKTSLYANHPNRFFLYNCKTKAPVVLTGMRDSMIYLDGNLLYSFSSLQANREPEDSYLVRFTASGDLLVPYLELKKDPSANKDIVQKLRVFTKGGKRQDIRSSFTVGISKDKKSFMTGYQTQQGQPVIETWNEYGKTGTFNAPFADFTEQGSVVYLQDDLLKLQTGDLTRQFKIKSDMGYVYVGGDEKTAIIQSYLPKKFYVYNMSYNVNDEYIGEELTGFNFKRKTFISLKKSEMLGFPDTILYKRDFSGRKLDKFSVKAGVFRAIYNEASDNVLVLDKNNRLHLLNHRLESKAEYQLSPNDLAGFTKNGKYIYYVRDTSVNLLQNKPIMENLNTLKDARKWFKTTKAGSKKLDAKSISEFLPPKESIWSLPEY